MNYFGQPKKTNQDLEKDIICSEPNQYAQIASRVHNLAL